MSQCCDIENPLVRDGVSQRQRETTALKTTYVRADERELADFLVFAYHLSQKVTYYNKGNRPEGNWQDFFTDSTPIQIALISKACSKIGKETYDQRLGVFLKDRADTTLESVLKSWMDDLLKPIQHWYENLSESTPLKSVIKSIVQTNLREPLLSMWGIERSYRPSSGWFYRNFSRTFDLSLEEPQEITLNLLGRMDAKAELDEIFQKFFQTHRQIIHEAPKYLKESLKARKDHSPYLTLYYVFLEVMKLAQKDLNQVTQRHLDFFYKDVLRLTPRPPEPDRAHLIFELAKSLTEYKLDPKTRFKAGKDATGKALFYKLDEEIVVHKAQVASLKGLFLDSQEIEKGPPPKLMRRLYASPQVNSADGRGGDFPKEQVVKAWLPFGDEQREQAEMGLAIASDILYLQEGIRTVTIILTLEAKPGELETELDNSNSAVPLSDIFTVDFSGEKDWIMGKIQEKSNLDDRILTLIVKLEADAEPVVFYHPKLPGASLATDNAPLDKPTARLKLKNQKIKNRLSPYSYLRTTKLTNLKVKVEVSEVRDLIVQNDLTVLDITKPFQPFGPQPKSGANLYIGSQEVFQKKLTELIIHLKLEEPKPNSWLDIYTAYDSAHDDSDPNQENSNFKPGILNLQALRKNTWSTAISTSLFDGQNISLNEEILTNLQLNYFTEIEPFEVWNLKSKNGFLRIQLTDTDFLHDRYPTVLSRQILAQALAANYRVVDEAYYRINGNIKKGRDLDFLGNAKPVIPKEPYTPVITSLSLSYTAEASYLEPADNITKPPDIRLFHLYPFEGFQLLSRNSTPSLLPSFHHEETQEIGLRDEGTLFIGLKDLNPPTALPLLFQVAEETANTDLEKADVHWYFLRGNEWKKFKNYQIVSDTTNGLINSGIVNLAVPAEISKKKTTILDPSLYWIKASVPERSGAICHIIDIHTQAAQVTFTDRNNDPNRLASPLPAGTIAKLASPQSEVKKVEQPYDSFGGQVKEQATHFYTRISEHLRHKGRAITIFDYERLVLEKFPEIYKVRCINHGQVDDKGQLHELVPGAVTLVVIPDLSQRPTTNDLEPKININLLQKIQEYLSQLSSPWVEIRVVNPVYEQIRVEFQVQFKESYQRNFDYYRRELERAIIGFLAPWTSGREYDLNLMSLNSADDLPTKGKRLVIVAKIGDCYHARIFDRNGKKVIDKGKDEFSPDERLVQQLEVAFSSQSIDQQTKSKLLRKITSSLDPILGRGVEIYFGGKVYRSSILNFVEEQKYVDYVVSFQMHQGNQLNLLEAKASSARSVLTSNTEHNIQEITGYPPAPPINGNKLGYKSLRNLKLQEEGEESS